ncbi:MAG TPA: hypothetical protein VH877_28405 [Polyangia bacterium]|nr:hypothetical protein [Polyangia bacterium]
MAEHGYFVKEMNAGWLEWTEDELPTHSQRHIDKGTLRCDCFKDPPAPGASPGTIQSAGDGKPAHPESGH